MKPQIKDGAIIIKTIYDLDYIYDWEVINKDIDIENDAYEDRNELDALTEIELPNLIEMTGKLRIEGLNAVVSVSLPNIEYLGGLSVRGNNRLEEFEIPSLDIVEGYVSFSANNALSEIDLGMLVSARGLIIGNNKNLEKVNARSLCRAKSIFISKNELLKQVKLSSIESITLEITKNKSLSSIYCPKLKASSKSKYSDNAPNFKLDMEELKDSTTQ